MNTEPVLRQQIEAQQRLIDRHKRERDAAVRALRAILMRCDYARNGYGKLRSEVDDIARMADDFLSTIKD